MSDRVQAAKTREMQRLFLAAYAELGTLWAASQRVGMHYHTHGKWMKSSEAYRVAFQEAEECAIQRLEQEARRRAFEGTEETVFHNGKAIGSTRKYSDVLLIFLLKSKRPDIYRDRFDARLSGSFQTAATVKVIHEYHDAPGAPTLPAVMATLALPVGQPDEAPEGTEDVPTETASSEEPASS